MILDPINSTLIVLNAQEHIVPRMHQHEDVLKRCVTLVTAAHRFGVSMVMTEQNMEGLGMTLSELTDVAKGQAQIIDKTNFSALKDGVFNAYVTDFLDPEVAQILICGFEAHVCVTQTSLDLLQAGYKVTVIADSVSSREAASKEFALRRLEAQGVQLVTTEMVLYEWIGSTDSASFKELSDLLT